MSVTIDEIVAEIDSDDRNVSSMNSVQNQNRISPDIELRRYRELHDYLAIRVARLRAE